MNNFAVILTHNRPDLLRQTVEAIGSQVEMVIVIDNASEPPVCHEDLGGEGRLVCVLNVPDQPPNLAKLWQVGIDAATNLRQTQHEISGEIPGPWRIAFLCDDAPPPPGWFDAVSAAMAQTGAAIGCSSPWPHHGPGIVHVKTAPDGDIMGRMPGWAWVLDPDSGVRPDPSMHWWFCDTSADFDARAAGGMVMIGGYPVPNVKPNEYTNAKPDLAERAGLDRAAFEAKHGWVPW